MKNIRLLLSVVSILLLITITWFVDIPHNISDDFSIIIEDRNNNILDASISKDQQWRFELPDSSINIKYVKALLTFEDKRFYYHKGVDIISLLRAFKLNILSGGIKSGGSTIDMQVIRLSRKNPPRTIIEKIKEVFRALFLDFKYTKTDILRMYASGAPYGGNVVGIEAASYRYFNHSSVQLSWAESCLLAVLPNNPSAIHPGRNRDKLLAKRNRLLKSLLHKNVINEDDFEWSQYEDLPEKSFTMPHNAPHLLIKAATENKSRKKHRITTTLDMQYQEQVIRIMELYKTKYRGNGIRNAAVLVLDNRTSEVLAYCANYHDYGNAETRSHVDMIMAPRSTGSILKPILYAAMLDEGEILTKSLVPDIPINIKGYAPKNFNRGYDGAAPANKALARSLNVPAVKMLLQYGVNKLHARLKRLGMQHINHPPAHYGLSLILGGCEGSLWELCGIYASFARTLHRYYETSGKYVHTDFHPPYIVKPENTPDMVLSDNPGEFSASSIYFTLLAMNEVERPGADVNWDFYSNSRKISWKTGTSFGFRDGWAIGISHNYVVGVWIGNADGEGRPELTGIKTAAPVMFDVFRILNENNQWFYPPYNEMEKIVVCKKSGFMAGPYCDITDTVWQPEAGLKSPVCPYHQLIYVNQDETYRVHAGCESQSNMKEKTWFILPPMMEWFYKQKNGWYVSPPVFRPDCQSNFETGQNNMQLIYPQNPSKIFIPLDLGSKQQSVLFEAAHRKPGTSIFWYIDNQYITETKQIHQISVNPSKGKHMLILTDEFGEMISVPFEITKDLK